MSRSADWLQRAVALFTVILMVCTGPLWFSRPGQIIQIPWLVELCQIPWWFDQIALVILFFGCVTKLVSGGSRRVRLAGDIAYVVGLGALVSLDQHRLQPWACQFLIFGVLSIPASSAMLISCWKWVIASIYVWSALSKLDASFFESHGQLLLSGMLSPLGIDTGFWSDDTRKVLAATFPVGELVVAILLLLPGVMWIGLWSSIVMHLALVWTLGFGLQHEWGVLVWNLFFIVQNLIVFGPESWKTKLLQPSIAPSRMSPADRAAIIWTLFACLYPALETVGYCDHWPAWAVYSSRPAQVKILIPEEDAKLLPQDLQPFLGQPAPLEERVPFNLDAWSYAFTSAPVYPQERYRLSLALALLRPHLPETSAVTVQVSLTPDRRTGERSVKRMHGMKALEHVCREFRLNFQPRGRGVPQG